MNILIVRHAETDYNKNRRIQGWVNKNLNSEGIKQAKKLAKRLQKEKIDVIYSSDLIRCKKTIEPYLKKNKVPIYYDKNLRERRFGIFEGKKGEEYQKWKEKENPNKDLNKRVPKGESFNDVMKRAIKSFEKIRKKEKGKNILIVTHGGTKAALIISLLKIDFNKFYKKYRPKNTALSIIKLNENGKHRARMISSVKHLGRKNAN